MSLNTTWFCHLVYEFMLLALPLPGQLWANVTSSTKLEIHNVPHHHQRRTLHQYWGQTFEILLAQNILSNANP